MEIRIGVKDVAREVVLESAQSAAEVQATVAAAVEGGGLLVLEDERGRTVLVPAGALGYVEVGAEESRRVGFGTI